MLCAELTPPAECPILLLVEGAPVPKTKKIEGLIEGILVILFGSAAPEVREALLEPAPRDCECEVAV